MRKRALLWQKQQHNYTSTPDGSAQLFIETPQCTVGHSAKSSAILGVGAQSTEAF